MRSGDQVLPLRSHHIGQVCGMLSLLYAELCRKLSDGMRLGVVRLIEAKRDFILLPRR